MKITDQTVENLAKLSRLKFEGDDKENYLRILIDFKNAIPLAIERGNLIGTRSLKITLNPQALKDTPKEWKNINTYTPKVYSDFAD